MIGGGEGGVTEVYKKEEGAKSALVGKQHSQREKRILEKEGYKSEKRQR